MARNAPEKVNRLTSPEQWTLAQWINSMDIQPGTTREQLAIQASQLLGKDVTVHNIKGLLLMVGKELPPLKRAVPQDEAVKLLALQVSTLCAALNIPLVDGFEDLLP